MRVAPNGGCGGIRWLHLLPLALLSAVPAQARFPANESSYLNFAIPAGLRRNVSWPHTPALFGDHYTLLAGEAGSVTLPVRFAFGQEKMCEIPPHSALAEWKLGEADPFILIVYRGACSYSRKVRNAQIIGASGVLIVDREDKHLDPADVMPNDGSGDDVSIPSMMIGRTAFEELEKILIKEEKKGNETVKVPSGRIVLAEMAWHKAKMGKRAHLDLWHSPIDLHTKEFLANFSKIAVTFDTANVDGDGDDDPTDEHNRLVFNEHPVLLDGNALGCVGHADKPGGDCYQLCTNGGRYCHVSHETTDGKDIVKEALRRLCIRKHYSSQAIYWQYILHFSEYCWDADYYSNSACIADAYKHSGVDGDQIHSCIVDSGDVDADDVNTLLEASLKLQRDLGIIKSPTVMINGDRSFLMFGGVTPMNVLYEVCETFKYGEKPHVCYACMACGDPVACAGRSPMRCEAGDGVEPEQIPAKGGGRKKKSHWGKWFFAIVLVAASAGGYVYYKKHVENGGGGGGGGRDGLGSYSLQDAFLSETG